MIRRLAPHAQLILFIAALAFIVASVWTIGETRLGVTLGLAAIGAACAALEWRIS